MDAEDLNSGSQAGRASTLSTLCCGRVSLTESARLAGQQPPPPAHLHLPLVSFQVTPGADLGLRWITQSLQNPYQIKMGLLRSREKGDGEAVRRVLQA